VNNNRSTLDQLKQINEKLELIVQALQSRPAIPDDGAYSTAPAPQNPTPWMDIAREYEGLHEDTDEETLLDLIKEGGLGHIIPTTQIPWCAGFVTGVLAKAGIKGTGTARARDYAQWGQELTEPKEGAVAVFNAHVAFYTSDDKILGGNQSDRVCEQPLRYYGHPIGYRWPEGYQIPA